MKRAKIKFLKTSNTIVVLLLAFIGFTPSCKHEMKYGTPSAKFIIKGKVESKISDEAIRNIQVIANNDTVITDNNGNYQIPDINSFPSDQTFEIHFKDIDGTLNSEYDNLDTVVEFTNFVTPNGDEDWRLSKMEKEFDVKMKPTE